MKLGLFSMNMYACSYPETATNVAREAENAGFESLWAGEHVVLPDPQAPPSPMAPLDRALDPVVALTYLAAVTTSIRLGTGIIILPQRNPLILAKELASLDVLSGGRLMFGLGVGYLEAEFAALGAPFAERGEVADEYLSAMKEIWSSENPSFSGRWVSFSGIQSRPQPEQRPHPPVHVGGHSPAAYRRAVEQGNGWYGFALTPAATARAIEALKEAGRTHERPAGLGELEISVTPRLARGSDAFDSGVIAEAVKEYDALGVDRLIVMPPSHLDFEGTKRFVAVSAAAAGL